MESLNGQYSLTNATLFGWNSLSGDLVPERVELLRHILGRVVLDAGCGGGAFVHHLRQQGFSAVGVEKHAMFLHAGRERGFQGPVLCSDLSRSLPFSDGAFDTTVCFDVLEHVEDDYQALKELARVTRRRIILTVPQEDTWMSRYRLLFVTYRDRTHQRYYTLETLRALAEAVHPARVDIFGEQRVLIRELATRFLRANSRFSALTPIYDALFRFLVTRTTSSPELHANLAAVIDLR